MGYKLSEKMLICVHNILETLYLAQIDQYFWKFELTNVWRLGF